MSKSLMIQGTSSGVGKSIISTGICRILKQDGNTVAPFKAQNMSNNAHILENGFEMARSQAIAAYACGIEPHQNMNPVLLKPLDGITEVVVTGKSEGTMSREEYKIFKQSIDLKILDAYKVLEEQYDIIVLEGAGSPVEMNLKDEDIVNMSMAQKVNSPVILVSDIDRGGVFASVFGTLELFSKSEKQRVKGIIINKLKGKKETFSDVQKYMEDITNIPVIGMIPYVELDIEDEDSLIDFKTGQKTAKLEMPSNDYREYMNTQFDSLAKVLREHMDVGKIYEIMEKGV